MSVLSLALAAVLMQIPGGTGGCATCRQAGTFAFRDGEVDQGLAVYRRAAEAGESSPVFWGEYGVFTAFLAPDGEPDSDLALESERALEEALGAEPDSPRWLFAYALLTWKRGVLAPEHLSLVEPLLEGFAEEREELERELTGPELARLYAIRARGLEVFGSDRRHGVTWIQPSSRGMACWLGRSYDCGLAISSMAVPAHLQRMTEAPVQDREDRLRALAAAFELEPGWSVTARGYLGELARQGRWQDFGRAASRYERSGDEPGWASAFRAAARWRTGFPGKADSLFDVALERLDENQRAVLLEVSQSVSPGNEERYLDSEPDVREAWSRYLLRVSDPLFLTPVNERRLEHFTRVVLAELWFPGEDGGVRGDRGSTLLRYGEPHYVWEAGRPGYLPRGDAENVGPVDPPPGQRLILWRYGLNRPEFLFQRAFRSTVARHTPRSRDKADELRRGEPSTFDFPVQDMPHQVVRFKGTGSDAEVDYYTVLPADSVSERSPAVETGLFFLPRTLQEGLVDLRRSVWLIPEPLYLTFRAPLNQGQYVYTFEALSEDGSLRRADRAILEVVPWPEDRVGVSDILVARHIESRGTEVLDRGDLRIRPAAELTFAEDEALAIYLEVYGLAEGADGAGGYTLEIEAESAQSRSIFGRILGGITGLVGGGDEPTAELSWERSVSAGRERIPEWFEIEMNWPRPGSYQLTVRVTDQVSGEEATAARRLSIRQ